MANPQTPRPNWRELADENDEQARVIRELQERVKELEKKEASPK